MRWLSLPLALLPIVFPLQAFAQQPPETRLRWSWREGARYQITYTSAQTQIMDQGTGSKVPTKITYRGQTKRRVKAVDGDGVATVVDTPEHIVCTLENPLGKATIDTRKPGIAGQANPMALMVGTKLRAVIGKPITTRIDTRGKVLEMKMPGFRGTGVVMKQMTRLSLMALPAKPAAAGARWQTSYDIDLMLLTRIIAARATERYRLQGPDETRPGLMAIDVRQGVEPRAVAGAMETKIDLEKSGGRILFDPVRGQLVESRVDSDFVIRSAGLVVDQQMRSTVAVKELPANRAPAKRAPEKASPEQAPRR